MGQELRKCKICGEEKESYDFQSQIHPISGREYFLRTCRICENFKLKQKRTKYSRRDSQLQHKFGITEVQYKQILKSQGGFCAICGQPETAKDKNDKKIRKLSVDHDHKTFKIRGLLCSNCNQALGKLKDDLEIFKKAIAYLERDQ